MSIISKLFYNHNKFSNKSVKGNTVLLLETNGCHGEVIGGYLQYFKMLGYNIDILVSNVIFREDPFARLNKKEFKLYHCNKREFFNLLTYDNIKDYKHIFVMSSVNYDFGEKAVVELYPDLKKHKSVFFVHHNLGYISKYYKKTNTDHNIMLGRFKNTQYINPHLFGNCAPIEKQHETVFVSVGGINPKRKNHTLLLNTIQKLHENNYKFKVYIVGSGSLKTISKDIKSHIILLGHLNYDKMYDYVEKSHYFLPLLDNKNPDHKQYIKTQVTGSAQLIYGFNKVPVIHKDFAKFYNFDANNAILYQDLFDGMKSAIETNSKEYDKKQQNIKKLATKIKSESLKTLQRILNEK